MLQGNRLCPVIISWLEERVAELIVGLKKVDGSAERNPEREQVPSLAMKSDAFVLRIFSSIEASAYERESDEEEQKTLWRSEG